MYCLNLRSICFHVKLHYFNLNFRNKAKLLSHVLNPNKKSKFKSSREENVPPPAPPPLPPPAPTSVPEKPTEILPERTYNFEEEEDQPIRKSSKSSSKRPISKRYVPSSSEDSEEDPIDSDLEESAPVSRKKKKTNNELMTVNMDDLGDLLSKPNMYYAKKSSPRAMASTLGKIWPLINYIIWR